MKWTPEKIARARSNLAEWSKLAIPHSMQDVFALADIGLRVVDPSPEDLERVAKVMFELDPAYRDSAGKQRIRFEDVRIYNGGYWMRRARAAFAAIAEDRE